MDLCDVVVRLFQLILISSCSSSLDKFTNSSRAVRIFSSKKEKKLDQALLWFTSDCPSSFLIIISCGSHSSHLCAEHSMSLIKTFHSLELERCSLSPSPFLLVYFSFHLLSFPIILLHWAEAFLLFSTINSKSFDIFHYFSLPCPVYVCSLLCSLCCMTMTTTKATESKLRKKSST